MNNVALRAGIVTGLHGNSRAASQQTGILGEDTARRMRARGIPLVRQPEEDAGLQLDATDATRADRRARLLNVHRHDAADVRRDLLRTLDASGFRAGDPRFHGEAGDASHAIAGTVRQVAAEAGARPTQVALAWMYARAGRLGVPLVPVPGTGHPRWLEVNVAALGMHLDATALARLDPLAGLVVGDRLRPRERRAPRLTDQTWPVPGSNQ
jgi:hypothetical protein